MTGPIPLHLAVEDVLQEAILRRILDQVGRHFSPGDCYSRGGFGYLKRTIGGFNQAARGTPFVVLTDLDRADCPPSLIREWLPGTRHPNLLFRIAVRAVESWIMADREAFARFLGIGLDLVPTDADAIESPKDFLVSLARRARRREVRAALVPSRGSTARVGPDFNGCLSGFLRELWKVEPARASSRSLDRSVAALSAFSPRWVPSEDR